MKSRFPPSPGAATDQFLRLCVSLTGCAIFYCSGPQPFWHQEPISWKTIFPWTSRGMVSGWFKRFMFIVSFISKGFPWWLRWWRICLECRWPGFDPWVRKIPWRRKWLPTLVFLPGEFPWTEEPSRLQSMGLQRVEQVWATNTFTFFKYLSYLLYSFICWGTLRFLPYLDYCK